MYKIRVRRQFFLLLCVLGWFVTGAKADKAQPEAKIENGTIYIAVASYRDSAGADLGVTVANLISAELAQTGRYTVRGDAQQQMTEARQQRLFGDPRAARDLGRLMRVSYIVYGTINSASCPVSQSTTRVKVGKNRYEERTSYSASASVSITHAIADVKSGKVWKQMTETGYASTPLSSDYITRSQASNLYNIACMKSVHQFVKQLVPEAQGRVTQIMPDGQVMVSLGFKDGAGKDIDFFFYRWVTLKNASGQTILDAKGQPISSKQPILPAEKKDACIGRATQVGDSYSVLDVGYNSRGGFFGSMKFKKRELQYSCLRVGDCVELAPRWREID